MNPIDLLALTAINPTAHDWLWARYPQPHTAAGDDWNRAIDGGMYHYSD